MNDKKLYDTYFKQLQEEINKQGLLSVTPIYGILQILGVTLTFILSLYYISSLPAILVILIFYTLTVQLGFISHDVIHGQFFKSKKLNIFLSKVVGNLFIGLSSSWWEKKHNLEHHIFTNSDIHDTDIRDYDEIFTKNEGRSQFFYKHRRYLFWISLSVLYFNLIILSYYHVIKNKKYFELFLNISYLLLLPLALVAEFGALLGLGYLLIIYILTGIHLGLVFIVNHIGMEIIDGERVKDYSWFDLQVRTSRNIKGGAIIHFLFGGLNKQIEHHLFSKASRNQIYKAAEITKEFCKQKGIYYHEVSFLEALKEIQYTLNTGKTR